MSSVSRNFRFVIACLFLSWACLSFFVHVLADDQKPLSQNDLNFFETKIRPVLVQHCYECHSEKSKEIGGNLLLDNRESLRKGGESGSILNLKKPAESLLLEAMMYSDLEMPPDEKLPDQVINDFKEWVKRGAPDPRLPKVGKANATVKNYDRESLWSFQPRQNPQVPRVKRSDWPTDPLDYFVLAKLEKQKLEPTIDADARTLVRRLYYDLIGLPPTVQQINKFAIEYEDNKIEATEKIVDELLASPEFGVRWGQHWLDVARYGESNGDDGLGRNASFPHAWRYRDYVIQSLNNDVPYDQFLKQQIAGDLLAAHSAEERNRNLTATGFLALGSKPAAAMNNNFAMDVVNDQINVVCTSVLGLSVACARCHDHKHDPIPTKDYYALAGIFTSTETLYGLAGNEKLTAPPTSLHDLYSELPNNQADFRKTPKFKSDYGQKIKSLQPKFFEPLQVKPTQLNVNNKVEFSKGQFAKFLPASGLTGSLPKESRSYSVSFWFKNETKNNARPITVYLFSRGQFGDKKLLGDHLGIGGTHEPEVMGKLFVFNGNVPNQKSVKGKTVVEPGTWNHVVLIRNKNRVQLFLNGSDKPELDDELPNTVGNSGEFCFGERADKFAPLQGHIAHATVFDRPIDASEAQLLHAASGQPRLKGVKSLGQVMGVRERTKVANTKIQINGSKAKLGAEVQRGVLTAYYDSSLVPTHASSKASSLQAFQLDPKSSGRLELVRWMTQRHHPQTSRVMVNRIWLHLFGRGIVETPDDFGVYGSRPTHPELLDHLANRLIDEGWSIKKMIRSIALSRTYRLHSQCRQDVVDADPDNRFYARHSRKRLDAEQIRDSILHASKQLDLSPKEGSDVDQTVALINWPVGQSTDLHQPSKHRSIYLCRLRHAPPKDLVAFDLPDGVSVVGQRDVTNKPTQSLFFMNGKFVLQQSRATALAMMPKLDLRERTQAIYRQIYKREANRDELSKALQFVENMVRQFEKSNTKTEEIELKSWASLCQALFASNEFRYID